MGAHDPLFWIGFRNIILFAVVAIPLAVFPALLLAALLNSKIPGMKVFRAIYFIPYVAGLLGVLLIWKQLYNASIGYINYGIDRLFALINLIPGLDLTAPQPEWLSDPKFAMWSIVIFFAWFMTGYNAVLFVAGMQGIPRSLYEAADIDGASWWQKFRNITVPMLRPTTFFVVATTTILGLQIFTRAIHSDGASAPALGTQQRHADARRAAVRGGLRAIQPGLRLGPRLGAVHLHLCRHARVLLAPAKSRTRRDRLSDDRPSGRHPAEIGADARASSLAGGGGRRSSVAPGST